MVSRGLAPLLLLAGLCAGVLVAGCGDDEPEPQRTTATTATTTTATVVQTTTVPGQPIYTETTATTETGVGIGSTDASGIVRPFAANSPWNTPIQSADVDPNSDVLMRLARERVDVNVRTGGDQGVDTRRRTLNDPLFINLRRWTTPVVDETDAVPTRVICRQPPLPPIGNTDERALCGDGWSVPSLLIPAGDDPHPEFDGWYTVLNRREGVAYDLWRARRAQDGGEISYQFMRKWDLNGTGFLSPNRVSARGSGLPLFAGLILPEEIEAGRIDHALAISVPAPAQQVYVQPASSTDGIGRIDSLPEGARIRLKAGITLRSIQRRFTDLRCRNPLFGLRDDTRRRRCRNFSFLPRTNQVAAAAIITALRRYGAIVVDRARVPTLYAKFNADWTRPLRSDGGTLLDERGRPFLRGQRREPTPLLRGNEVQGLRLADFEVIRLGERLRYPQLGTISAAPLAGGVEGQQPAGAPNTRTTPPSQQTFQPAGTGG